ncbi:hypothetical protein Tco_1216305 [Tanacetum coccineum]
MVLLLFQLEIFEQLALIGYHTESDKLTFQKGVFSPQWRFLIHNILHCLSPKKTAWEQFSSNIAAVVICLATNRKFNFSRMIFEHMVSNISSPHKFLMYLRFIQICLDMQRHQFQQHTRTYHVPSLTMKVFSNMKRPTKGFSGQEVALFPTMLAVPAPSTSPSRITFSPSPIPSHSAYTKLILRVKKLESQIKIRKARKQARVVLSDDEALWRLFLSKLWRKFFDEVVQEKAYTSTEEVPIVSTAEVDISTVGGTITYVRRSAEKRSRQDKGKAIMFEEEPKKKSKEGT